MMLRAVFAVVLVLVSSNLLFAAATPRRKIDEAELSRQITAAAQELLDAERKAVERWRKAESAYEPDEASGDGVGSLLFEDVISMLDTAAGIDTKNMRPHALLAQVMLLKAYQADSTYDVCSLLDARDEASWIVQHSTDAAPADLKIARDLIRAIKAIPADRIPDPPSACGDDDRAAGTNTVGLSSHTRRRGRSRMHRTSPHPAQTSRLGSTG